MHLSAIELYRCPACRQELAFAEKSRAEHDEVLEGTLRCTACAAEYPISDGIVRFVPTDNYTHTFGYQWNIHRRTQLDSHTGLSISRDRLFGATGWQERLEGETILEAGSGAGRFSEILAATGARLFTFDYSLAVNANRENNGRFGNVDFSQADIFNIPMLQGAFDKVLCLGVIQHTPDPERAFASLAKLVRPGGELVIDVYENSFPALMHWRYLLRPISRRMDKKTLNRLIETVAPVLVPATALLRRLGGRIGARLSPISEYSHLGLPKALNVQWAVLDTFDMYSPTHDHPQSLASVRGWFERAGFKDISIRRGANGVIGKGRLPG